MSDTGLFLLINGLAGRIKPLDDLLIGIASDYFLPVIACLILVTLWFGIRDFRLRKLNQEAIIAAVSSIGIVNGLVDLCNNYYFRVRPFNALPPDQMHLLFYKPTDSSFPSNFSAALFALALPIVIRNNKCGAVLLFIALLGGFARVFVGIHYPLDILGGAAIGVFTGFFSFGLIKLVGPVIDYLLSFMRKLYVA
jgi:undecaprenyl-diphosphatase